MVGLLNVKNGVGTGEDFAFSSLNLLVPEAQW